MSLASHSVFQTDFVLDAGPVIPVLTLHDDEALLPLADALVAGGLKVFEVVLRTPDALGVIDKLRPLVPILGAGTVLEAAQMHAAKAAGAQFCVCPGLTPALHAAALELAMPLLPGAVTASEVMAARELGYKNLKFFPAERSGGSQALADLGAVFPDIRFCPTGGVSVDNAAAYLRNRNVACVGGTLATPQQLVQARDWAGLTAHVREMLRSLDLQPVSRSTLPEVL